MSVVVSIAVTVADGDTTLVQVLRGESVLPATATGDEIDLVDLARATLSRLGAEAGAIADEQVVALRGLLEGAA